MNRKATREASINNRQETAAERLGTRFALRRTRIGRSALDGLAVGRGACGDLPNGASDAAE